MWTHPWHIFSLWELFSLAFRELDERIPLILWLLGEQISVSCKHAIKVFLVWRRKTVFGGVEQFTRPWFIIARSLHAHISRNWIYALWKYTHMPAHTHAHKGFLAGWRATIHHHPHLRNDIQGIIFQARWQPRNDLGHCITSPPFKLMSTDSIRKLTKKVSSLTPWLNEFFQFLTAIHPKQREEYLKFNSAIAGNRHRGRRAN